MPGTSIFDAVLLLIDNYTSWLHASLQSSAHVNLASSNISKRLSWCSEIAGRFVFIRANEAMFVSIILAQVAAVTLQASFVVHMQFIVNFLLDALFDLE